MVLAAGPLKVGVVGPRGLRVLADRWERFGRGAGLDENGRRASRALPHAHTCSRSRLASVSARAGAQVLRRLEQERIGTLYHFTSVENLPSISEDQALCCKEDLDGRGKWPAVPGGNALSQSLDAHHGNRDYVELNFTLHNPMAHYRKRERHICWFIVEPRVAALPGVLFTDTNAAANDHRRAGGVDGLNLVSFDAVRSAPRPWDRDGWVRPVQAEVIVPGRVALADVREVAFVSEASREEGERLWSARPHPPFVVSPTLFGDAPDAPPTFPHMVRAVLTDQQVDRDSAGTVVHVNRFARSDAGQLTFVGTAEVLAGTSDLVRWQPSGHESSHQFDQTTRYNFWRGIRRARLHSGSHSVTIELNGVRWATLPFEVRP